MAMTKAKADSAVTTFIPNPTDTFEVTVTVPKVLGFKVRGFGDILLDLEKVSVANISWAVVHGFGQRLPDSAAISRTDKDGRIVPQDQRDRTKGEKMTELRDFYETGTEEWERAKRGGDGGAAVEMARVLQAIMKVSAISNEEALRRSKIHADNLFGGDVRRALKHLATGKRVAEVLREMEAQRMPDDLPDADELVDQLGQGDVSEEQ